MKYFYLLFVLQVNGLDVSDCSHDEAVKILSAASEPITVVVKHRNSAAAKDDNDKVSDDNGGLKVSSKCSREIQTDPAEEVINNVCDQCGDLYNSYFNYNCDIQLDPEDSFIYPELQYEVKIFHKKYSVIKREGQKVETCHFGKEYTFCSSSLLKLLPKVGHLMIVFDILEKLNFLWFSLYP